MESDPAIEKLRHICSRQEKCPADVLGLLKRWGVPESAHQEIINKLRSEKYLDEHRYAGAFVADKLKFDHWGIIKIRYLLQQKGINRAVTDSVLGEIDQGAYRAMVGHELSKKRKSIKGSPREIWAKLARYGASRGYEMDVMREFLGGESVDDG